MFILETEPVFVKRCHFKLYMQTISLRIPGLVLYPL